MNCQVDVRGRWLSRRHPGRRSAAQDNPRLRAHGFSDRAVCVARRPAQDDASWQRPKPRRVPLKPCAAWFWRKPQVPAGIPLAVRPRSWADAAVSALQAVWEAIATFVVAVLPYVLAVVVAVATYRLYNKWRAAKAREAVRAERWAREMVSMKARYTAALFDDVDSQDWIPASPLRTPAQLLEPGAPPAATPPSAAAQDPPELPQTAAAAAPTAAAPAAAPAMQFPRSSHLRRVGRVASVSFRSPATKAQGWGGPSCGVEAPSGAFSIPVASAAGWQVMPAAAADDSIEVETWDDDAADEDDGGAPWGRGALEEEEEEEEEDLVAAEEWRRFLKASRLDCVVHHWDASQLLEERPVPECLERNF